MQLSRKMEDKANSGGNTAVEAAGNLTTPTKKTVKAKPKTAHSKASHPPTSEMVSAAIKELKDRKGSSVQAIKKYIATTYKVDGEKIAPFIKRYLKTAVTSGAVVQTKGKGASGSFKLSVGKGSENLKSKKRLRTPRKAESKKVQSVEKKTAAKKTVAPKKAASPKKTAAAKKPAAVKKTAAKAVAKPKADLKTMSKAKKTTKAPAAKTRIPKPKRAAAPKAVKSAKK